MAKSQTEADKKARAQARREKAAAAKAKADAENKAAEQEIKDAESGAEAKTVPVEPCPACPPGHRRLRSVYPNYRWRGVQFHGHCALVDESKFTLAQADPFFGQGKHFWEDKAA